jgi:curved DNA-binding protein CbpA
MKNHYQTLGLTFSATEAEIKLAYKKLATKFHPDKNDGDDFFTERFKDIQEAYDTLSDSEKRKHYDEIWKQFFANGKKQTTPPKEDNRQSKTANYPSESYKKENVPNNSSDNLNKNIFLVAILVVGVFVLVMSMKSNSRIETEIPIEDVSYVDTATTDVIVDSAVAATPPAQDSSGILKKLLENKESNIAVTDDEALSYVNDYYDFYRRDYKFRNPKLKKVSDYEFQVSLEECIDDPAFTEGNTFWHAVVYTLHVNYDKTYNLNRIQ